MRHYTHLTIEEREKILVMNEAGRSQNSIARELGRDKSSISRELNRNTPEGGGYSAVKAQEMYRKRRNICVRKKVLHIKEVFEKVARLFFEEQWSPEQISERLKLENSKFRISYNTIYRAIYSGMFNTLELRLKYMFNKAHRKLRHRGKRRKKDNTEETRGKFKVINTIHERPDEAEYRMEKGHWEQDTVVGKKVGARLATATDRMSRYLLLNKTASGKKEDVANAIIDMFSPIPIEYIKSFIPDQGKEFADYPIISKALNDVPFYFADPGSPWQRGLNENTNGLVREYFPKSFDFNNVSDAQIKEVEEKINKRPRKCLNWFSPYEIFHGVLLHLT